LAELDLNGRVREALRADAGTADYADRLVVATIGSRAVIEGIVDGVDDTDVIVDVVSRVPGISEVDDRMTLRG
jgi:osmotically-inducible protein OsmY